MLPNPFVEFASDPVSTLAWVGYALFLLALIVASIWWSLRKCGVLAVRWQKNRHGDDWWSGPLDIGVLPPPSWTLGLVSVLFVWAVTAWAFGALIWLVG